MVRIAFKCRVFNTEGDGENAPQLEPLDPLEPAQVDLYVRQVCFVSLRTRCVENKH